MTVLPILMRIAITLPTRLYQSSNLLNLQVSERTLELRREKEELNDTLTLLRRTQAQLVESEKMASLGGLVAGVAHEINTPVGNALTVASHLGAQTVDLKAAYTAKTMKRSDLEAYIDSATEAGRIIGTNLERAADLVQSFKRVAVDQASEERRCFLVREYMDEILLSLHARIKKTAVQVRIHCADDLRIETYPGALSQVISNLILNSLLHAYDPDQPGFIDIDIDRHSNTLANLYPYKPVRPGPGLPTGHRELIVIRFRDDGHGIPAEHMDKLFDPFFTTRRNTGGSGLGLNIVYNIVSQTLGGEIECRSEAGKGAEFTIRFAECGPGNSDHR